MENEVNKYAELLISMSTDYLLGNIEMEHYVNMIHTISNTLKSK